MDCKKYIPTRVYEDALCPPLLVKSKPILSNCSRRSINITLIVFVVCMLIYLNNQR